VSVRPLPPGPRAGVLRQTISFHRDPLGFLRAAQATHGDVFTIRLLTARPVVVVGDPAAAARLLDAGYDAAGAGEARRAVLPFASERSVFGGDGERHGAARRRIEPALSSAAMAARTEAIAAIAARRAAAWPRGRPLRLLERTREICDEIFVTLVLGVPDREQAASLIAAIRGTLRTPGNPPLTLPGPGDGWAGALGQRLFERRARGVVRELSRAIEARRAAPAGEVPDVLGCMLAAEPALSTAGMVDELMSLLMAAQEPPAIALAWLLDRLAREPEAAQRLLAEPEGATAAALVAETLRLQPPASAALRHLQSPFEAGGHVLPAGMTTIVPTSLLQRDSRAWEDPDRFRLDRWPADPPPGFYLPFGGGVRRCVGEHLAKAEIAAVLPTVLAELQLRPLRAEPEPMVQRATVLVPKRGLLAIAD
jgi:cytochrome P450